MTLIPGLLLAFLVFPVLGANAFVGIFPFGGLDGYGYEFSRAERVAQAVVGVAAAALGLFLIVSAIQ